MKRENKGFTMVELLTVLGIIALLVGILIPALKAVKEAAKNTKQKAQFTTLDMALQAFRNDYGDYPPSKGYDYPADPGPDGYLDYCGAQKLAEAMVGYDLLGFHPKSDWLSSGWDRTDTIYLYDANDPVLLDQRKEPYLELTTANVFRLGDISPLRPGLFRLGDIQGGLWPDTFVLCDAFGFKTIRMPNGESVRAGSPILYYRANTAGKTINRIYDVRDNDVIVATKQQADGSSPTKYHPLAESNTGYFYNYITDPRVVARRQPYNPRSYILISAGADGLYGTADDIRNFGN